MLIAPSDVLTTLELGLLGKSQVSDSTRQPRYVTVPFPKQETHPFQRAILLRDVRASIGALLSSPPETQIGIAASHTSLADISEHLALLISAQLLASLVPMFAGVKISVLVIEGAAEFLQPEGSMSGSPVLTEIQGGEELAEGEEFRKRAWDLSYRVSDAVGRNVREFVQQILEGAFFTERGTASDAAAEVADLAIRVVTFRALADVWGRGSDTVEVAEGDVRPVALRVAEVYLAAARELQDEGALEREIEALLLRVFKGSVLDDGVVFEPGREGDADRIWNFDDEEAGPAVARMAIRLRRREESGGAIQSPYPLSLEEVRDLYAALPSSPSPEAIAELTRFSVGRYGLTPEDSEALEEWLARPPAPEGEIDPHAMEPPPRLVRIAAVYNEGVAYLRDVMGLDERRRARQMMISALEHDTRARRILDADTRDVGGRASYAYMAAQMILEDAYGWRVAESSIEAIRRILVENILPDHLHPLISYILIGSRSLPEAQERAREIVRIRGELMEWLRARPFWEKGQKIGAAAEALGQALWEGSINGALEGERQGVPAVSEFSLPNAQASAILELLRQIERYGEAEDEEPYGDVGDDRPDSSASRWRRRWVKGMIEDDGDAHEALGSALETYLRERTAPIAWGIVWGHLQETVDSLGDVSPRRVSENFIAITTAYIAILDGLVRTGHDVGDRATHDMVRRVLQRINWVNVGRKPRNVRPAARQALEEALRRKR